jgi:hypothetical protein
VATIEHKIDETDDHEKRQHEADKMVKKRKWPGALAKALVDEPWDYNLKLRTGDLIRFNGAEKQDDQGSGSN